MLLHNVLLSIKGWHVPYLAYPGEHALLASLIGHLAADAIFIVLDHQFFLVKLRGGRTMSL